MDDQQLGALVRAIRLRRGLRQEDVATIAGVSGGSVSLIERGHLPRLSLETLRRVAAAVDVRVEVVGRWRGGNADRLLSRRHSLLAESFVSFLGSRPGWTVEPEVSFSVYGERGIIWRPRTVSAWLIVSDTKTNRRHATEHATLLRSRFRLDGRRFCGWLMDPAEPTTGLAFWTDSNGSSTRPGSGAARALAAARSAQDRAPMPGDRAAERETARDRAHPGVERRLRGPQSGLVLRGV